MKMIRGVNLGGWLVLERYITPYQFAITDCHIEGNFCWYPHQLSAPPVEHPSFQFCSQVQSNVSEPTNVLSSESGDHQLRVNDDDMNEPQRYCKPVRIENAFGNVDFPIDEKTLVQAFLQYNTTKPLTHEQRYQIAEQWFNYHFEYFISKSDLERLQEANITHVRVPLPHWILGDDIRTQPPYKELWMPGQRWKYFARLCHWARDLGLSVWPDIHTAPGSQNGFGKSNISCTLRFEEHFNIEEAQ
jgi:glucan 1,3-beta-glucosidase